MIFNTQNTFVKPIPSTHLKIVNIFTNILIVELSDLKNYSVCFLEMSAEVDIGKEVLDLVINLREISEVNHTDLDKKTFKFLRENYKSINEREYFLLYLAYTAFIDFLDEILSKKELKQLNKLLQNVSNNHYTFN